MISVLFGCVEMFLIDLFSIWLLVHPWSTLCQPDPPFEKADCISIWIVSQLSELISVLFGCLEIVLIDFFSIRIVINVLN